MELTPDEKLALEFELVCTSPDLLTNAENALIIAAEELKQNLPKLSMKMDHLSELIRESYDAKIGHSKRKVA